MRATGDMTARANEGQFWKIRIIWKKKPKSPENLDNETDFDGKSGKSGKSGISGKSSLCVCLAWWKLCQRPGPLGVLHRKDRMGSMDTSEADAVAAFALSSPDVSDFGSSPAGRALVEAREEYDSAYFDAFKDTPSPQSAKHSTSAAVVGQSSRIMSPLGLPQCLPSVEETTC